MCLLKVLEPEGETDVYWQNKPHVAFNSSNVSHVSFPFNIQGSFLSQTG